MKKGKGRQGEEGAAVNCTSGKGLQKRFELVWHGLYVKNLLIGVVAGNGD